jgi:hypothetical protein
MLFIEVSEWGVVVNFGEPVFGCRPARFVVMPVFIVHRCANAKFEASISIISLAYTRKPFGL